jgi:copper chaperone
MGAASDRKRIREGRRMSTVTVTVTGMSCGHCASSVREEVGGIPGVTAVDIDMASGKVIIDSDRQVDAAAIKSAVEEAGYQLAS